MGNASLTVRANAELDAAIDTLEAGWSRDTARSDQIANRITRLFSDAGKKGGMGHVVLRERGEEGARWIDVENGAASATFKIGGAKAGPDAVALGVDIRPAPQIRGVREPSSNSVTVTFAEGTDRIDARGAAAVARAVDEVVNQIVRADQKARFASRQVAADAR